MRSFLTVLLAAAILAALLSHQATGQCTPYGQTCTSSGMQLVCSSAPQIGTTWNIGERSAFACGLSSTTPGAIFTIYGVCFPPGIPIGNNLSCSACGGCFLHILPSLGAIAWTWPPRTQGITIANNPALVGATFCMQDVCVEPTAACICMSQAIQVVIQ